MKLSHAASQRRHEAHKAVQVDIHISVSDTHSADKSHVFQIKITQSTLRTLQSCKYAETGMRMNQVEVRYEICMMLLPTMPAEVIPF